MFDTRADITDGICPRRHRHSYKINVKKLASLKCLLWTTSKKLAELKQPISHKVILLNF